MLDLHALTVTPGAGTTLGSPGTVAVNDGCPTAGVPLDSAKGVATLKVWGFHAPTADTIAALKMYTQDMIDTTNGYTVTPNTTNVKTQYYDYVTQQFKTGARIITAGTNTGVVAGSAWTVDSYANKAPCLALNEMTGNIVVPGSTVFGGALTTNQWGSVAFNPTQPLPIGKYAILGAFGRAITNDALLRFSHANFNGLKPGFPIANYEVAYATAKQLCMNDELMLTADGAQFMYLSKILNEPCCPVFNVGPGATGLTIEMCDVQADTPDITLVLSQVSAGGQ